MPSSARRVVDVPQKCRDAPEDSSIESLAAKVTKTHGEGEQVWVKLTTKDAATRSAASVGFRASTASE